MTVETTQKMIENAKKMGMGIDQYRETSEFEAQILRDKEEFGEFIYQVVKVIARPIEGRNTLQLCIGENMLDVFAELEVTPQGILPVLTWKKSYGIIPDNREFENNRQWWGLIEDGKLVAVSHGEGTMTPEDFGNDDIPLNPDKKYVTVPLSISRA
jgi:hypothetical protein